MVTLAVFKYPLEVIDEQVLSLPRGAKILSFAEQHGGYCIWALVDPQRPQGTCRIRLAGTGHPINYAPDNLAFIGTALAMDGNFVLHAFEVLPL